MKILALLNQDGGTLKTLDLDWLAALIRDEFQVHGHEITVERCKGKAIVDTIRSASERTDIDVLMVGGGDGTVSAAAMALTGKSIALAILPAGTMNLFARTLQIPLDLTEAIAALASGQVLAVDVGTVNGEPFVHQFAVGLHARMVRMREGLTYRSRIGKIIASSRAVFLALKQLPSVELVIEIDGAQQRISSPAVAISNNLYGEGHVPYADDPRGGVLGVYICRVKAPRAVMKLTFDILRGSWRQNPHLEVLTAHKVAFEYNGRHHDKRAVRDGELTRLEPSMLVEIKPQALNVLVPAEASYLVPASEPTVALAK
ncbi:MAG: diacylglycerol kinase family protein [Aurantimonas endophytica]|uniref:Diacylglycerol kinase family enzyme n=1 Tax=Aurantimonas endophytica TaxID=1522175 RepID=A0A7W6HC66_9HYPH|nr:diacylglycerol kinase family protein [Aurantimonas endophytica]MBB4002466.1 diacylglycerol kinase family enzyme [Aurantimonas endophytica]MCO6401913.1 diacylglycerol kinase [Aurantimonas endophytica]